MVSRIVPGPETLGGRRVPRAHEKEHGGDEMRPSKQHASFAQQTLQHLGTTLSLQLLPRGNKNKTMAHKLGKPRLSDLQNP